MGRGEPGYASDGPVHMCACSSTCTSNRPQHAHTGQVQVDLHMCARMPPCHSCKTSCAHWPTTCVARLQIGHGPVMSCNLAVGTSVLDCSVEQISQKPKQKKILRFFNQTESLAHTLLPTVLHRNIVYGWWPQMVLFPWMGILPP